MRWFSLLAVFTMAAPAYGQQDEAEKLFRAMEKKIRSAKSLQLTFAGELTGDAVKGMKGTIKGTAYLAAGNKFRIEADGDVMGKTEKRLLVSDGKSTYEKSGDKVNPKPQPPDYEKVSGIVARLGMTGSYVLPLEVSPSSDPPKKKEPFDLDKKLPVKDFKLGPKEKIGQRDVQVVEYTIVLPLFPAKVAVSIDVQSQLPLKFVVVVEMSGKEFLRLVETIGVTVDGKIDPKLFEIPAQ
jgi:hypothetical protein